MKFWLRAPLSAGRCWRWVVPGWRPLIQIPWQKGLLSAQVQHAVRPSALPVSHVHTPRGGLQFYTVYVWKKTDKTQALYQVKITLNPWRYRLLLLVLLVSDLPVKKEHLTVIQSYSQSPFWAWRANRPQWLCTPQVRISGTVVNWHSQ